MNLQDFSLMPFHAGENRPDIRITGAIGKSSNTLSISCALLGNMSHLAIPPLVELPERKDRLWEDTCLEFFLGIKGSRRYWEFNLSPSGNWNVYRFTSYREGMREESAIGALPFRVLTEPGAIRFSLELDIEKILPAGKAIEAAVCAVIKTVMGNTSHWALIHPGPRPDFHRRDGFVLNMHAE